MTSTRSAIVVGAGPAGLASAACLARDGNDLRQITREGTNVPGPTNLTPLKGKEERQEQPTAPAHKEPGPQASAHRLLPTVYTQTTEHIHGQAT